MGAVTVHRLVGVGITRRVLVSLSPIFSTEVVTASLMMHRGNTPLLSLRVSLRILVIYVMLLLFPPNLCMWLVKDRGWEMVGLNVARSRFRG